jgi:hypothetical protein
MVFLFAAMACDDDHDPAHEHEFSNYSQCYTHHAEDEGVAPQEALDECDEIFHDDTEFADLDACVAFYAGIESVPAAEAQAHCEALFP